MSAKVQRLRIIYSRGLELRYVAHLDLMRFWERAVRRAQLPVSYSEGFSPHAQIALGAPLSVGATGQAELLDIHLHTALDTGEVQERLQAQLPPGVSVIGVTELPLNAPSVQSLLRAADYRLHFAAAVDQAGLARTVDQFLARDSVPWDHVREKDTKHYDLRPLVIALQLEQCADHPVLTARLRADEGNTGRPDQLAAALGVGSELTLVERMALILAAEAS